MSLRSADESKIGLHRLRGQSITAQLAQLYTLSAVVLLAIVIGGLQWLEGQSLLAENRHFLNDKVKQLRQILKQHPDDAIFIEQEVKFEGGEYAHGVHYILYSRILDNHGHVLVETPGAENILPPALFPPPKDHIDITQEGQLRKAVNGRSYLLASSWEQADNGLSGRRIIQVGLDTADAEDFLTQYQRGSILIVLLGIGLSAYVGVLIAKRGLRSLCEITHTIDQITATQLHQRVRPERWPLELVALAQAFDRMLTRLDESHIRLTQFSADLAHELRTPINALMGQTEVALTKEQPAEEYWQILASNLEELQRLSRMINEMLFLAHADDPKTEIERSWLDARRELDNVREFHEALAEDHGVTVSCQGQAKIFADPRLIRRAITNLLSNALRHTPRNGQVVLYVESSDDWVEFRVSDTGCGIQRENQSEIFERFYRPNQSNSRQGEGTGLGLAIVKSIAELHGGTTALESSPGCGTTVILRFPVPKISDA